MNSTNTFLYCDMNIAGIANIDDEFLMFNKGHIYSDTIERVERTLIEAALEESHGNRIAAAKILGIHRNTLHLKVKKLNINVDRFKI